MPLQAHYTEYLSYSPEPALWRRWLKFNFVGLLGVGVQLAALALLVKLAHLNYLPATAIAVETAVLHNFVWHERFTWKDRTGLSRTQRLARLVRFNLSNGAISVLGNLALMRLLTGTLHVNYLIANLAAVGILSLANFAVSHTFVFGSP
jgi:putative flippase GtrA